MRGVRQNNALESGGDLKARVTFCPTLPLQHADVGGYVATVNFAATNDGVKVRDSNYGRAETAPEATTRRVAAATQPVSSMGRASPHKVHASPRG